MIPHCLCGGDEGVACDPGADQDRPEKRDPFHMQRPLKSRGYQRLRPLSLAPLHARGREWSAQFLETSAHRARASIKEQRGSRWQTPWCHSDNEKRGTAFAMTPHAVTSTPTGTRTPVPRLRT